MDVPNGLGVPQETLDAEIKSFFESAPPLKSSDDIGEKLKKFIERNSLSLGKFTL
jgi:phosphopantothenate-cysteine ligase